MSQSKVHVYSRFDLPPSPSLKFAKASLTRQEFADESDLNKIMEKYAAGIAPIPRGDRAPMFGDFSSLPDYQTSLEMIRQADDAFMQLPSKLRERFDNDPAKLLDFLGDKANREEAISLGLIDKPVSDQVPVLDPVKESAA